MSTFPCERCKSKCCGPIALYQGEAKKIIAHLRNLPIAEVLRVSKQKRKYLEGLLIDKEKNRCLAYEARPVICDLFGRTPGMECPYNPEGIKEISKESAHVRLRLVITPEVVQLGLDWDWSRILEEIGNAR